LSGSRSAKVVIIGAGIAGVSVAYHLAVRRGVEGVTIVDPRPPLTLTSDKSTECYRNWWPNQPMVSLMNRSIDLFEDLATESSNAFGLSRRGYLYVTGEQRRLERLIEDAYVTSSLGGGDVRIHHDATTYGEASDGVDVLYPGALRERFPYITQDAVGAAHIRRAGWFSAQQLGSWMLERAKEAGAMLLSSAVVDIAIENGAVTGAVLTDGSTIETAIVVNAAGPMSHGVGVMAGIDLPLLSELHLKVAFRDHRGVIPRSAPMIIWNDPQYIDWSDEERDELRQMGRDDLLDEMPIFCHGRPEGSSESPYFLALWEYHHMVLEPTWPLPSDDLYPEAVMRGLTTMVPELEVYLDGLPESTVDGGYYTKTRENRPLIGPAGPKGFHLMCGMSGFGVMVSAASADLVASHIVGAPLPEYSDAFLLSRYDDPEYLEAIAREENSGQL
jgi:sarcosine oxidase subunit beta